MLDIQYYFVLKTKYNYPILVDAVSIRLREILQTIAKQYKLDLIKGDIAPKHLQLLISAPANISPSMIAQLLKARTSHLLAQEFPELKKRHRGLSFWSNDYLCHTIGSITPEIIDSYVNKSQD